MNDPREDQSPDTTHPKVQGGGKSVVGELVSGNVDGIVGMQYTFPKAGTYTVQFSMVPIQTVGNAPNRATAEVLWMVDGNTIRREITVVPGASISGVAEGVQVNIRDSSTDFGAGGLGKRYRVSASVAPGVRASTTLPPRRLGTVEFVSVAAGASTSQNIPPDAGIVSFLVLVNGTAAALALVEVRQFSGVVGPIVDQNMQAFAGMGFIPLFPGVDKVTVTNNGATGIIVQLIWGVDG